MDVPKYFAVEADSYYYENNYIVPKRDLIKESFRFKFDFNFDLFCRKDKKIYLRKKSKKLIMF